MMLGYAQVGNASLMYTGSDIMINSRKLGHTRIDLTLVIVVESRMY